MWVVTLQRTYTMVSALSRSKDSLKGLARSPFTKASINISSFRGFIFTIISQNRLGKFQSGSPLYISNRSINFWGLDLICRELLKEQLEESLERVYCAIWDYAKPL